MTLKIHTPFVLSLVLLGATATAHAEDTAPSQQSESVASVERPWSVGVGVRTLSNEGSLLPLPWLHVRRSVSAHSAVDAAFTGLYLCDGDCEGAGMVTAGLRYRALESALSPTAAMRPGIAVWKLDTDTHAFGVLETGLGLNWAISQRLDLDLELGPMLTTMNDDEARLLGYGDLDLSMRF